MEWEIQLRRQAREDRSAHVLARWTGSNNIEGVEMKPGPGVRSMSFGGSTRRVLSAFDKPLEGVFRWDEDATPVVNIRWIDPRTGQGHERRVTLA